MPPRRIIPEALPASSKEELSKKIREEFSTITQLASANARGKALLVAHDLRVMKQSIEQIQTSMKNINVNIRQYDKRLDDDEEETKRIISQRSRIFKAFKVDPDVNKELYGKLRKHDRTHKVFWMCSGARGEKDGICRVIHVPHSGSQGFAPTHDKQKVLTHIQKVHLRTKRKAELDGYKAAGPWVE